MFRNKQLESIEKKLDEYNSTETEAVQAFTVEFHGMREHFAAMIETFERMREQEKSVSSAKAKRGKKKLSEKEKKARKAAYMKAWYAKNKKSKK
jgi:hypothetical protein